MLPVGNNAVMAGVVESLDDPETLGRVKVKFMHLPDGRNQSNWARIASPMAGKGRGFFFRPEKGDEVLVVFEQGDPRRPYIIGALWSQPDKPPSDDGNKTANNWRFIRSRSGHIVKLDDTVGGERIEIIDKDKNSQIVLDPVGKKIEVICKQSAIEVKCQRGKIDVECGQGSIQLKCDQGDISLKTGMGSVKVEATTVEIKAATAINLEANSLISLKAPMVKLN